MKRSELKQLIREIIEEVSQGEQKYVDAVLKDTNANMTEQEFDKQVIKNLTDWYTSMLGGDVKKATKQVNFKAGYDEDFWGDVYSIFREKYGHPPKKVEGYPR